MGRRSFAAVAISICSVAWILATAGTLAEPASAASAPRPCSFEAGLGGYNSANPPGPCWRPYNDESPFNRQILHGTPSTAESAANVFRLIAGGGQPAEFVVGDPEHDSGVPIYWSQPSDPLYTLHCTKPWGRCDLEGLAIRVPGQARPAGGWSTPANEHDAHMTVIDQRNGWEYDLWQAQSKTGSVLNFSWGGRTRIDGSGLGSDAVAARYGSIAGPIRFQELAGGNIGHALTIAVPCTNTFVYPAVQTGATCTQAGLPNGFSIPMGTRFVLDMTVAEIASLAVPAWKKTILRTLAAYGAYVSDSTGIRAWGMEIESGESYTSFGRPNPWIQFARDAGVSGQDFDGNGIPEYRLHMAGGVNWGRLRTVGVCAALGTCPTAPVPALPAVTSLQKKAGQRVKRCWRKRAAWARRYRRTHEDLTRRYFRVLSRWERRCSQIAG